MKKLFYLLATAMLIIAGNSCQKFDLGRIYNHHQNENTEANVATDWYKLQLKILLERNSALTGVYFGYIGIGLYESVRYGSNNSVSLSTKLYHMPEMPGIENNKVYNWQVSANAAMASMVRSLYTGLTVANIASIDSLEKAYNDKLSPGINSEVFNRSQSFGRSIATTIYNWYLTDDFNASNVGYVPPVFPGTWVPTPPAFVNGINPYIGNATPYLQSDLSGFAPAHIPYSEDPNSDFYKMVKYLYDVSQTLTTDQKNTALYWVDQGNGLGYTADGHNIAIVTEAIDQTNSNLGIAAEVYAKTGIAERESTIECFRSKYHFNLLRPVSYIKKLIDPNWLPFIVTPPFPEYPAAHAYVTGAVMQAAASVLGNHVKVTDGIYVFRGWPSRTYNTLFAAAEEAGISRLYGGIHFLPSINTGLELAKELGNKIGNINLHG
ncbi:MAG: vanadium-dependent haloperoxidase [Ginsengibacter sp.]